MIEDRLKENLLAVSRYYDSKKVGDVGNQGFRKSTHLAALADSLPHLIRHRFLEPGKSHFLDMGCADGRVNVFLSYLVKTSVGVELDDWTLDEYAPLRKELDAELTAQGLALPPDNIHLFLGDTCDEAMDQRIQQETGLAFENFDLFYTYITLHDVFARLIAEKARKGALFMVYGLDLVLPRYKGLTLLEAESPIHNKLVLYKKD